MISRIHLCHSSIKSSSNKTQSQSIYIWSMCHKAPCCINVSMWSLVQIFKVPYSSERIYNIVPWNLLVCWRNSMLFIYNIGLITFTPYDIGDFHSTVVSIKFFFKWKVWLGSIQLSSGCCVILIFCFVFCSSLCKFSSKPTAESNCLITNGGLFFQHNSMN